jgi:hypothetical protein
MRLQQVETSSGQQRTWLEATNVNNEIYSAWRRACLMGAVFAVTISAIVATVVRMKLAEHRSGIYTVIAVETVALAAILEGAVIGYFQWRVLRRVFPTMSSSAWVGATMIAAASGCVLSWLPTSFALTSALATRIGDVTMSPWATARVVLVTGALVGLIWGIAQFAVLRLHVHHAGAWILSGVITWTLAFAALYFAAIWPDRTVDYTFHILLATSAGAVLGALLGVLHGGALVRLRSRLLNAHP